MSDEPKVEQVPPTDPSADSALFGVSIRAWLAIMLVATVCTNNLVNMGAQTWIAVTKQDFGQLTNFSIVEPLYSMSVAALGFYFGQKKQP